MPDPVIAIFGLVFSLYRQRCEEMFTAEAAVTRSPRTAALRNCAPC